MSRQKETKTNAMRILDRLSISYETFSYECGEFIDGKHTADLLGFPHEMMYKTLVTETPNHTYYVFVLPIDTEIDFKKAARAAGCKSLSMIPVKQINTITGYIRGGCTAIGMKKNYPVLIEQTALSLDRMIVSGGKIGMQIALAPTDLAAACHGSFGDFTVSSSEE